MLNCYVLNIFIIFSICVHVYNTFPYSVIIYHKIHTAHNLIHTMYSTDTFPMVLRALCVSYLIDVSVTSFLCSVIKFI